MARHAAPHGISEEGAASVPIPHARVAARLGVELLLTLLLMACSSEKRTLGADLPQTAPTGPHDPRVPAYEQNAFQVSQGSRYFTWYGCGSCHGDYAKGPLDLSSAEREHGGSFDRTYAEIAQHRQTGNATYGSRIPVEQLWQITAYVRNLRETPPEKRRRQDIDQQGEPQGDNWTGPIE